MPSPPTAGDERQVAQRDQARHEPARLPRRDLGQRTESPAWWIAQVISSSRITDLLGAAALPTTGGSGGRAGGTSCRLPQDTDRQLEEPLGFAAFALLDERGARKVRADEIGEDFEERSGAHARACDRNPQRFGQELEKAITLSAQEVVLALQPGESLATVLVQVEAALIDDLRRGLDQMLVAVVRESRGSRQPGDDERVTRVGDST